MKKCPSCSAELKKRYIGNYNDPSKIKCPKCKMKLKATTLSMILLGLVVVLPLIPVFMLLNNMFLRLAIAVIWPGISVGIFRPMIFKFEIDESRVKSEELKVKR